ncbi:MAG: hypothetical protein NTY33_02760 [Candidatus Moranbacteria bacterium]|nr:hypothetical protein [Candidatus Moranbacteria bacterium]
MEKSMERFSQPSSEGKLSEEQALLYQEYATKLEGKEFSEKSSNEAYEEADMLLKKLQDSQFDWLGIDWDKVDFKDSSQIRDMEKRLDAAVRSLAQNEKDNDGILRKIANSSKGAILPFALSVMLLMNAGGAKAAEGWANELESQRAKYYPDAEKKEPVRVKYRINDHNPMMFYENPIYDWAEANPEKSAKIEAIFIDNVDYKEEGQENGENFEILKVDVKVRIIVLTKEKKALTIEGSYSGQDVKSTLKTSVDYGENDLEKESIASRKAIMDAMEKIGTQL